MELSTLGLKDRAQWEAKGYQLPQFDRAAVTEATRENPCWIHFGAGNIFRAFQANVMQNILKGFLNSSIVYFLAAPRPVEEYETSQLLSLRSIACFPLELIILPSSVIEYVPGSSFNLNVEQVSFFLFTIFIPFIL